jgi:predicted tellurium resistance membrane protein TerC
MAMEQRIILLFLISFLVGLSKALFEINSPWISAQLSWQSIILLVGGLVLLYKSTMEILKN